MHIYLLKVGYTISYKNWHAETTRVSTQLANTRQAVAVSGNGLHGTIAPSLGNDYLLVIIDQLMSQIHLVPTTMWVTAREVARLFLKEVVRLHRVPESIVSDCDTKFMSTFWCKLHKLMGTKLLMSTAFHPQMDGTIEWANCSIVWECSSRMIRRIGQPNAQW